MISLVLGVGLASFAQVSGKDVAKAIEDRKAHVLVVEGSHPTPGSYLYKGSRSINPYEVKRVFESMGFSARVSHIDPNGSVTSGAYQIASEVGNSSEPVVVVAHSLGGLKALEALRLSTCTRKNTFGLIMADVPYWGSIATERSIQVSKEVIETFLEPERILLDSHDACVEGVRMWADFWNPWRHLNPFWMAFENSVYLANKIPNQAYRTVMRERTRLITQDVDHILFHYLMGDGNPTIMRDLSTRFRENYMRSYAQEFREMQIPIVSVVGTDGHSATEPEIRQALGSSPSDGLLLTTEQEFISGEHFIELRRYLHHLELFLAPQAHLDTWEACVDAVVRAAKRTNRA